MTSDEIKSRNIALATYMGWKQSPMGLWWHEEDCKTGESSPPPFHEDMNLLMPVVWNLVLDGYKVEIEGQLIDFHKGGILEFPSASYVAMNSYPDTLFWAVSSLVMELQKKDV